MIYRHSERYVRKHEKSFVKTLAVIISRERVPEREIVFLFLASG